MIPGSKVGFRDDRSLIPNFVEESLRIESPIKGDFRLTRRPVTVGGVDLGAGTTVMVLNGGGQPATPSSSPIPTRSTSNATTPARIWPSDGGCIPVPVPPWPGPRPG